MEKKKIFMSLLLAASMTACINDAEVEGPDSSNPPLVENGGNVSFKFVVPNSSGSNRSSAEDSGIYEQGSSDEYALKNVRLYLFYAESKNIYKSFNVNVSNADDKSDPLTVTYTCPDPIKVDPGVYDIYAIANRPTTLNAPSVQALLADEDKSSYPNGSLSSAENGLIMSNRGTANLGVKIAAPSENDVTTNITIKLERAVAKLMLTKGYDAFELLDDNQNLYATISLTNYRYFNLSRWFYTFRHVATLENGNDDTYLVEPSYTISDSYFGSIPLTNGYAIDPYFFKKKVAGAESFTNSDGYYAQPFRENSAANITSSMPAVNDYASIYCLENCMYRPAQKRDYTTGIVFKANIKIERSHTFNGELNGETPITVEPSEQSKLYYFNYNFYTSLKALHDIGKANVPENESQLTPEIMKKYGIEIFEKNSSGSYDCYYNYFIQHEPSESAAMGVMEFGIVRNNIYKVRITNVNGLGSGTPDVEPGKDDKYKAYLKVDFAIYPWIVREDPNGTLE